MTLGDERGFGAADQDMMTAAGLAHLTAVSGEINTNGDGFTYANCALVA